MLSGRVPGFLSRAAAPLGLFCLLLLGPATPSSEETKAPALPADLCYRRALELDPRMTDSYVSLGKLKAESP